VNRFQTIFRLAYFLLEYNHHHMPKRSNKTTGKEKNPAAVALGKLGASKGGKARAKLLSAERRSEIARNAVLARWNKNK
jgi:hypothetical protein